METGALGASGAMHSAQTTQLRRAAGGDDLTPQERQQVQKLRQIDQKVRQHEAAHQAAGAGLAGGASFQYVRGPDGRQYAVGGEVSINVAPSQSPEQTIDKARRIQAAALAPADPSAQDRAVAAQAAQMQVQAQLELNRRKQEMAREDGQANAPAELAQGPGRTSNLSAYADYEPAPPPTLSLFA